MTILDDTTPSTGVHRGGWAAPGAGWATTRGRRAFAADAAAVRASVTGSVAALADGIGDTDGAACAARVAVDAAVDAAARGAGTWGAMATAGRALRAARDGDPDLGDAVLVVAAVDSVGWSVCWVGDCRAYLVPAAGPARQLTVDHTAAEYLRSCGLRPAPRWEHMVTTTVARSGAGEAGVLSGPAGPGRLVLVSDGVHRVLAPAQIARIARSDADPVTAACHLVEAALAAGTSDNAAATVVDRQ